jgi:hypothetical protein
MKYCYCIFATCKLTTSDSSQPHDLELEGTCKGNARAESGSQSRPTFASVRFIRHCPTRKGFSLPNTPIRTAGRGPPGSGEALFPDLERRCRLHLWSVCSGDPAALGSSPSDRVALAPARTCHACPSFSEGDRFATSQRPSEAGGRQKAPRRSKSASRWHISVSALVS